MAEISPAERLRRLQDLAELSIRRGFCTFSDFLPAADAALAYRAAEAWRITLWGGREDCERQMVRFSPEAAAENTDDFPIAALLIRPADGRFAEELTHRDYLGACMSLGITRESLGDLFLTDGAALVFAQEKLAGYLCEQLVRVRNTNVCCERIETVPTSLGPRFERLSFTLASLRMDALAANLTRLSRGKAKELFSREMVLLNGRLCENESVPPKEGDIITIRRYGKFIFREVLGESRKGRLIVHVDRYV